MSTISNTDNTIDSRDIIARIKELEDDAEELRILTELAEECETLASDWQYGETLIHRDYFETYMDEMIEDCYTLPKDMPSWMSIKLDYVALEQDYSSVDFDGQEYLIRSV